nr:Uncharacterised protein [Klebsiella pneumoniae]
MRLFTLMSSRSPLSDSQYAVIYDLHSHTTASDGRLTPQELVHRAHEMRVGTRRSPTMTAWRRSRRPGGDRPRRITLDPVNGVEISTLWENHEIHIVGLNIDIAHPTMTALLEEQKARRQQRGQMIAERRRRRGSPAPGKGAATGGRWRRHPRPFCPFSGGGRPCENMAEVFKNTLPAGKPVTCRRSGVQ